MNKLVVLIFICCTPLWGVAQEHQYVNKKEVLAINNVYRIDEFNALDSVGFKNEFPNGYFSLYNEEGQVIKANNYQSYVVDAEKNHHDEYINYYFYDENDNRIGFIQQFTEGDEPFQIVSLESISSDQKTIQFVTATPSLEGYEIKFRETNYNPTQSAIGDTVEITATHHRAYGVLDSSFYLDIFYSESAGLVDSTIYHNKCLGKLRSEKCQSKTFFTYDEQGKLTSKRIEYHSNTSEINPYQVRTASYNDKGLVETLETKLLNSSIYDRELRKFIYTFRSDN